jgi:4-diphosphocytidyl-2-C-methyl-D-erythritol kinase
MILSASAPAKVNRELRVGRIRPDGFHEIHSRMVSISLADRITVETAETLAFHSDDRAIPTGRDNLVVRAAELLASRTGVPARARIVLEKRVPMGGGLGGGSADAAVTLRLLARLWQIEADEAWLGRLAAEIGSDVPFFLTGGEADVTGRGEVVTPVPDGPPADLLLLVPPFSISTAGVYRVHGGRFDLPRRLEIAVPGRRGYLGPNDLASAVLEQEPRMQAYLESAAGVTADSAISGSGSTIVLHGAPSGAEAALAARHPEARIVRCRTLTRDDYQRESNPRGGLP